MKECSRGGVLVQRRRLDRNRRLSGECIDPRSHAGPQFIAGPSEPIEQRHRKRDVSDVVRLLHMGIGAAGIENADSRQVRMIPHAPAAIRRYRHCRRPEIRIRADCGTSSAAFTSGKMDVLSSRDRHALLRIRTKPDFPDPLSP